LLEEQVAWEKGEKLAKELNVKIDNNRYWKYADRCLNSYLKERLNDVC